MNSNKSLIHFFLQNYKGVLENDNYIKAIFMQNMLGNNKYICPKCNYYILIDLYIEHLYTCSYNS